jgi:hypothetical protein
VLHPNGESQVYSVKRNIFESQPKRSNVYPGSVIFVPRELDEATLGIAAQAYVSILGN